MPKVIADITMSLDGFVTGEGADEQHGLGDAPELHTWVMHRDAVDTEVLEQATAQSGGSSTSCTCTSPRWCSVAAHRCSTALRAAVAFPDRIDKVVLVGCPAFVPGWHQPRCSPVATNKRSGPRGPGNRPKPSSSSTSC